MDWFKVYSKGWLQGSIRVQLTLEERAIWIDLLSLASESRMRGTICRATGIPYTREYLANFLGVPLDILNSTIEKCQRDYSDDGTPRIVVDDAGCLVIGNWSKYQAVPLGKQRIQEDSRERELRERKQARLLANRYPDEVLDKMQDAVNKAVQRGKDNVS